MASIFPPNLDIVLNSITKKNANGGFKIILLIAESAFGNKFEICTGNKNMKGLPSDGQSQVLVVMW